ncbi:START domain-containing protein 10 isoform X2 [Sparus aurata]|uniref:START domain-containing protein 10 isoform X2 n=1 Tax=Sparus aurata TaxID=8175 RepID=UPI0011C1A7B0|nr:START domain-containing protein 10-like isoform X2 [Sparus aurata]
MKNGGRINSQEKQRMIHRLVVVWVQEGGRKMRIVCKDVTAETLYDVLHDTSYRKKWDTNMIDTYDIARLTANADIGYYSWKCPSPLKNRDFVTMRSWLPLGNDYLIINYSVKHPQHPPKKDYVRAVSLLTGYLIQSNGANCSTLYYLTQVDPKVSLDLSCIKVQTLNDIRSVIYCRVVTKVGGEQSLSVCCSEGHEEDLQGIPEVSRVEEEAQPQPEAMDVPRAECAAVHQRVGANSAACRLSGEHRREQPERGEDAAQRRGGDLNVLTD